MHFYQRFSSDDGESKSLLGSKEQQEAKYQFSRNRFMYLHLVMTLLLLSSGGFLVWVKTLSQSASIAPVSTTGDEAMLEVMVRVAPIKQLPHLLFFVVDDLGFNGTSEYSVVLMR